MPRSIRPVTLSAAHPFKPATLSLLLCALLASLALWSTSAVAVEPLEFETPEQEERFDKLAEELRCLVCQNQSLADSDAILARDLRDEVHAMVMQGNTDEEIKSFLVSRYGDFVLYRPPVRKDTLLLWLAPLLLLTGGAVIMAITISRRRVMLAQEALEEAAAAAGVSVDSSPGQDSGPDSGAGSDSGSDPDSGSGAKPGPSTSGEARQT